MRREMMRSVGPLVSVGVIVFLGVLAARDAYPWGDTGHEMICEIAFKALKPKERAQGRALLQEDPDLRLFSKACTWPDHPRKRAGEHFVNLPRAATGFGDDPCPV